jgi:hypothetical protein
MFTHHLEVRPSELLVCERWRILRQMPSYDIKDQMLIVVASAVLHNFIRIQIERIRDLSGIKVSPMT